MVPDHFLFFLEADRGLRGFVYDYLQRPEPTIIDDLASHPSFHPPYILYYLGFSYK